MASIDEVAQLAGVSTATVSRALSGRGHVSAAAREKVQAAADQLGYVVSSRASSLASGRTRNIGVVVPYLDRWFFSTILSGVSSALMREGYDITLYNITDDKKVRAEVFTDFLRRKRVDGVIAIAIEFDDTETEALLNLGLPVLTVGGPNQKLEALTVDNSALAHLATHHLLSLGHKRIAHIGARAEFDADFHIPSQRRHGFEQALTEAGLHADPHLLEPGDFSIDGGYRAAKQILGRPGPHPTAIFAASDEMAIGAVLAARDLGFRVPEDVSVVGIDGHDLGEFFQLTTVDQFPLRQGEQAAQTILARLADAESRDASSPPVAAAPATGEPTPHALPYELHVRGTTARVAD